MNAGPSRKTDGSGGRTVAPEAIELRGAEPIPYFYENMIVLAGCVMASAAMAIFAVLCLKEGTSNKALIVVGFIAAIGLGTIIGAITSLRSLARERYFARLPARLIVERDHVTIHGVNRDGEYEYHLDWSPGVHCVIVPVERAGIFNRVSVLEIRTATGVFRRIRFPRATDSELAQLCRVLDRFFHRRTP